MPSEPVVSVRTAAPLPAQPPRIKRVYVLLSILIFLLIIVAVLQNSGSQQSSVPSPPAQVAVLRLTAPQIVAEYEANEVAADDSY